MGRGLVGLKGRRRRGLVLRVVILLGRSETIVGGIWRLFIIEVRVNILGLFCIGFFEIFVCFNLLTLLVIHIDLYILINQLLLP